MFWIILSPYAGFAEQQRVDAAGEHLKIPPLLESIRFDSDIRFCGIRIPVEDQDVKELLEKELLLALWDRPQVILWMKRSAKYFPHIETIIQQYGLPADLKYIPLIESGLRPHVNSSKNAVGYWQFLESTGKRHGLRIDHMVDERRNIFDSTHAACKYLTQLNKRFESYLLALCAYNMGQSALSREMKAQDASDFFSLYLPQQTQQYIFKAIAVKMILEHPQDYGFDFEPEDFYPVFSFDKVNLTSDFQLPITLLGKAAGVPFKTIKEYNPQLRGYYTAQGNLSVFIPKGTARGFKEKFAVEYEKWVKTDSRRIHIVRQGESLIGISKIYRMSLSSLLELNKLSSKGMIHPGDKLWIK
ncbi:MAG: transglycosylase SLT domain-containing protein [Proteobacteria bacterium]|nr:transglycosylase SLT domain-containing protein [Pseudomonadota bacterium]MBU1387520.1 transglycosylase SLT domain-containing protein [Pseudomonadota bacterium]MBU1543179.1 transglycosylase SLT domain-containing protein [Pseudomonadota bacterium]MBU2480939.1 transglycosylase SLT domain-containing protein [Pseudomonadota bacterium]